MKLPTRARAGLLALVPVLIAAAARSASPDATSRAIEAKVALESSLEKRIHAVLNEVLGTDKVIVIINVDMLNQEEQDKKTEILPGVPLKETPASSALAQTLTMVRKVACTLILDTQTAPRDIELAKKVTTGLLGLNAERGDSLIVEKMSFYKEPPFDYQKLLVPPDLYHTLWLLIAAFALFLVLLSFFRPLISVGRDMTAAVRAQADAMAKAGQEGKAEEGPEVGPSGTAANGAAASNGNGHGEAEAARALLPFGFVKERHIGPLIHLLRKEDAETVAVVVHYLPAQLGSRLLDSMEPMVRNKAAGKLAVVEELDQQKVKSIEEKIQSKIEYLVGGEDRLMGLLETASPEAQKSMLAEVARKDADLGDRLSRELPQLEDLGRLELREFQALLKRVPLATLAHVLKTVPEAASKLVSQLPEGQAARLQDEMDTARPVARERAEEELRTVLAALRTLVREGWVRLKRGPLAPGGQA